MTPEEWIEEIHQRTFKHGFLVGERLFSERSHYKQVEVINTRSHGRTLFLNREVITSERDGFIYNEMMVHVPIFSHPEPRSALILGGGDGGVLIEVLRHKSIERCVVVEQDETVIRACREHMPGVEAAYSDKRTEIAMGNIVTYVAEAPEKKFDLVFVEPSDPVGAAAPMFGERFYDNIHRLLTNDGMVVSHAESPFYDLTWQKTHLRILKGLYQRVALYNYDNMTYPGGLWSFSYACKGDLCPLTDFDAGKVVSSKLEFLYYTPAVHRAAFTFPAFQEKGLTQHVTPLKVSL